MAVTVREVLARSILSKSGITGVDYCVNPYTGCAHGCRYCYATFMKRFTGHAEPWGTFVDAKVNAAHLLARQLRRARPGTVMFSSVTDPYQPLERRFMLTRACLAELLPYPVEVHVLTKSPLVLRDVDLFEKLRKVAVGVTITTDNDRIRRLFEPHAPSIRQRADALRGLRARGIPTYAFVGPLLPMNPDAVADLLSPHTDCVLIDQMNYVQKTVAIYRSRGLTQWLDGHFVGGIVERLSQSLEQRGVEVCRV